METLILKYEFLKKELSINSDIALEEFIDFICDLTTNTNETIVFFHIYRQEIAEILRSFSTDYPFLINNNYLYSKLYSSDITFFLRDYFINGRLSYTNRSIINLLFKYDLRYQMKINEVRNTINYDALFINKIRDNLILELKCQSKDLPLINNYLNILYSKNFQDLSMNLIVRVS